MMYMYQRIATGMQGLIPSLTGIFEQTATESIQWCVSLRIPRILIVSHDGTITAYRQYLGEKVTRQDFLGETGSHQYFI